MRFMYKFLKKLRAKLLIPKNASIDKNTYWSNKIIAKVYDSNTKDPSIDNILNKIYCDYVEKYSTKGESILDIGAGTGIISIELSKRGYNITATDISFEMLSILKNKNQNISIFQGDIRNIKLNRKFETIVTRWFLPHMRDWKEIIKKISKDFLIEGGYFIFDMPNKRHIEISKNGTNQISDEIFGYNDDTLASDNYFYASATNDEIIKLCNENNLKFVERIPHGIFKSNRIIATYSGGKIFKNNNELLRNIKKNKYLYDFVYSYEKYITPNLNSDYVHGSIVVLKKL